MALLASFYAHNVGVADELVDYASYTTRAAARGIIYNGRQVAVIYVAAQQHYMLPGGGIDAGEAPAEALVREAVEEIGCRVMVDRLVGQIMIYNDRWQQRQTDTCFLAYVIDKTDLAYTAFEAAEGYEVHWASSTDEAIIWLASARPPGTEGKLITKRDLLFLQTAQKLFGL